MGQLDDSQISKQSRRRVGAVVYDLQKILRVTEEACDEGTPEGTAVTEVRFRMQEGGVQVIVKALDHAGSPVVAFVGGGSFVEALAALERALGADGLRWRVDRPYQPKG